MESIRFNVIAFGVLALMVITAGPAQGSVSHCTGGEFPAAGHKAFDKAMCYAKAVNAGDPVASTCLPKADASFSARFMNAEAFGDCRSNADPGVVEAEVDSFIATILQDVNNNAAGPSNCDAKKIHAVGVKARAKAACYGHAAKHTRLSTDPNLNLVLRHCLKVATTHFAKTIATAEQAGDCTHTGQTAILEGDVDSFISDLTNTLVPPPTSTTTTSTTTTT